MTAAPGSGATIFALASGAGRAGVAVIRVSGPEAGSVLCALAGRDGLPPPRRAVRVRLAEPGAGAALDDGLALWFPAPHSYTGEDVCELHVHGGRATVAAVTAALARLPGLRLAEPGEFTRRAFLGGRLDLVEAEAVADLVDAETDAQRRLALRQLEGGLSARLEGWRSRLIAARAHVEALIDFADEELPHAVGEAARTALEALAGEIRGFLDDGRRGERLRDGLRVAILGAPNVGKSSLLNAIARRDAAIVSETAGTTRDVVEVHLDLGGWPVTLADTAGLRAAAADAVEREGMRRARARAEDADVRVVVFDAAAPGPPDPASLALLDRRAVAVLNKIDLAKGRVNNINGVEVFRTSAATGAGLPALLAALEQRAAALGAGLEAAPITRLRHRRALEDALGAIERSFGCAEAELAAEELRAAADAIGRVTGRVDVEELLDVIFADFCIGK